MSQHSSELVDGYVELVHDWLNHGGGWLDQDNTPDDVKACMATVHRQHLLALDDVAPVPCDIGDGEIGRTLESTAIRGAHENLQ